ncbi:MAG: hypothetical protein ABWZ78_09130 [Burkholderiaceae bacterium]
MRLVNGYIGRLQRVAVRDPVVARAFIDVVHMLAAPATLFAPRIFWRTLRGRYAHLAFRAGSRAAT